MTIKDTLEVEGVRTTAGAAFLARHIPKQDAVAVARVKAAGAVILGKTNVPFMASDIQSYNDVFGTTNNPWDLERTPGGSTGGGAASLAAGMSYLSVGSDIGGSIRTPANFCGVYDFKPTIDLVPQRGHIPPLPGGPPPPPMDLPVVGPLGRSARDLRLLLEIIAGPDRAESVAYSWKMTPPRRKALKDYRIGYMLDDPICPVVPEVKELLMAAVDALRDAGATVEEGWPARVNPRKQLKTYWYLLMSTIDQAATKTQIEEFIEMGKSDPGGIRDIRAQAATGLHPRWLQETTNRMGAREVWAAYFEDHDAFLLPTSFVPAFPHDHSPQAERILKTSLGDRDYFDLLTWIAFATLTGNPAASMPVGQTEGGLPVGLQIMGPYLEDATPIDLAEKLSEVTGGFDAPPGYV